jgi:glycosyltransferase involved in cell wall biosynthesis
MKKFSVIIPCFCCSKTIAGALDSLVAQSYDDFEVILIDDASPDFEETSSVIQQYCNTLQIILLRNLINKNGAYSRNRGIEAAQGEYIAFLDSDDSWVPNRLQSALDLISTIKTEEFILYGRFELIQHHHKGAILPLRPIKKNELVSEYVFAAGQLMQTSTFVCSASAAKNVMFDEKLTRHQDSDFMMRAQSKNIDLIYQNEKCATYFIKPSDIVDRIRVGRININFCSTWLKDKQTYFNKISHAGYNLSVKSRILYLEKNKLKAYLLALSSIPKIGVNNSILLIRTKLYVFFTSRLGL